MHRLLLLPFLLVAGLDAVADEKPARAAHVLGADAVLAAWQAKDDAALKALAGRNTPDPWRVADELCSRGVHAAATAFARAATRKATEKLAAYVDAQRTSPTSARVRTAWETVRAAIDRNDGTAVPPLAKPFEDAPPSVTAVLLAWGRGDALLQTGRLEEGVRVLLKGAAVARILGWGSATALIHDRAARGAFQRADWPTALRSLEASLVIKKELGDRRAAAETLGNIGLVRQKLGEYEEAMRAQRSALAIHRERGDRAAEAVALGNIGNIQILIAEYAAALRTQREALAIFEALGLQPGVVRTLGNIGVVQEMQGAFVDSLRTQERVLALHKEVGNSAGEATAHTNLGNLHLKLGDCPAALRAHERALAIHQGSGDRAREAMALGNLGVVYSQLRNYPKALHIQRRALVLKRALGDRAGAATTLANLGIIQADLGDYPAALQATEVALASKKSLGDRAGVAWTTGQLGSLYLTLGNDEKALRLFEEERDLWTTISGSRRGLNGALGRIGLVHERRLELKRALRVQESVLALHEAGPDPQGIAFTVGVIGRLHRKLGDHSNALVAHRRALALAETLKDRDLVARACGQLGLTTVASGAPQKGLAYLERAAREAYHLRTTPLLVKYQGNLARVRLEGGDVGRALADARGALPYLEEILGNLAEEEGAATRARFADVFGVGTLAAIRSRELAEALRFLESGRAGSLLESLDGRSALEWTDLPEPLRQAEAEANAVEARARHEFERVLPAGSLDERRTKLRALDAARERVREVHARIQREEKRQAGLFYPRAATLEEIQEHLAPATALVLYGLCLDEALALILTRERVRVVSLGKAEAILGACRALDASDVGVDATPGLGRLRALLVTPLGLSAAIAQVLVSPEGPLCYLPFGALFEGPATALTPSGTTHRLLQEEERKPGSGVFALGDPAYGPSADSDAAAVYWRGHRLLRLPATRKEAETVGSKVLCGQAASEHAFRRTMEKSVQERRRWRAVHLACHGLLDVERPTLCSLALSRDEQEDGFLTCHEVLRLRIPADLVVLSACETSKGRIYRGEGIVGFTRAFLYAGAPRVVCSLWKVDDDATQALMRRFYALWRPQDGKQGLGAAAALKQAQAFVRSQEEWKHPYYWAAWVLWGLPE